MVRIRETHLVASEIEGYAGVVQILFPQKGTSSMECAATQAK